MKKYSYDGKLTTNSIKKGMGVQLRNGWYGIMADNMRGNTRMVDVAGIYREIGSVYSHDIVMFYATDDKPLELGGDIEITCSKKWCTDALCSHTEIMAGHVARKVEHTKEQEDLRARVESFDRLKPYLGEQYDNRARIK